MPKVGEMEVISRAEAKARGLKKYFTGKVCPQGHAAERYTESCGCVACGPGKKARHIARETLEAKAIRRAKAKVYRENNTEKRRADLKRWRQQNGDRERAQQKAARAANPEKQCRTNPAYYAANREKELARSKAYQGANKQSVAAKQKEWKAANREAVNAIRNNRRAREMAAEGKYTKGDVERLLAVQKGKCAECRKGIKGGYHVDHIVPLIKGGTNWPNNLQLLCQRCNNKKYDKDPIEWAKENGRLL